MMSVADWRAMRTGGARAIVAAINRSYADTSYVAKSTPPPEPVYFDVEPGQSYDVADTSAVTTPAQLWAIFAAEAASMGMTLRPLPNTAWTTGEKFTLNGGPAHATSYDYHWDGTNWANGAAATDEPETVEFVGTEIPES